jgi:hypothetical protein
MTEPNLVLRERQLLKDLLEAAATRGRDEPAVLAAFRQHMAQAEKALQESLAACDQALEDERLDTDSEYQAATTAAADRYAEEEARMRSEADEARRNANAAYTQGKEAAETTYKEACWAAGAVLEGFKNDAKTRMTSHRNQLTEYLEILRTIRTETVDLLDGWEQPVADLQAEAKELPGGRDVKAFPRDLAESIDDAKRMQTGLRLLWAPRMLRPGRLYPLLVGIFVLLVLPLGFLIRIIGNLEWKLPPTIVFGAATSLGVTALFGALFHRFLVARTRSASHALFVPLARLIDEAEGSYEVIVERAKMNLRDEVNAQKVKHNEEVRHAHARCQDAVVTLRRQRDLLLPVIENNSLEQAQAALRHRDEELRAGEEHCVARHEQARLQHETESARIREEHQRRLEQIRAQNAGSWQAVTTAWRDALRRNKESVAEVNAMSRQLFPPWQDPSFERWSPPEAVPPVLRFGQFAVRYDRIPHGVPDDPRLKEATPAGFEVPAVCAFPEQSPLMFQAGGEGQEAAVTALQHALLRLLTSLPAGKVRLIIIDPIGLGQNFAAFMNLADYDDKLVASRIWTETPHIDQRLNDLTAHMENVIQKYLRNQFPTIDDYNKHAGEVAEPYRILVVANFPVNFSNDAMRRLLSITQSGPRCGVFTLVSVDTRQPLPKTFDLGDMQRSGCTLVWENNRFVWQDPGFRPYPLTLDAPPEDDVANRILHKVGAAARDAHRVEVPFEFIAPAPEEWWTGDSRKGLRVALGRAGAVARQYFELGKGTSQHGVVAGKTGSGKSTLLHALITNLALNYSPDEVELYLIDFKKGVEFKTYAAHSLPHARVIAIESEREFGLSVLQRLDAELRTRGDRFRAVEAQDLASYRAACPDAYAPRILLIVDEFQEFFTEDDRLSQDAAQLLDRLVRQGRAFGMHVFLGSQTLGGAFSLARSTIDQMAVRIALQCSEADANLILSDDNSAARLLSRPGEAIYNDANGLMEGNHPFQVVWLPDTRREEYLENIHEMARRRRLRSPSVPVIFEGNAAADVTKNTRIREVLSSPELRAPDTKRGNLAWLGDALAINDQTAAPFRRQNGSNLMVVGQQEETALGMIMVAMISLAPQGTPEDPPQFYVLDGRQAEPPQNDNPLARMPQVLPCSVRLGGWRETAAILGEVSAECARRQQAPERPGPPIYLILFALQRLRDLRREEDDFSFTKKSDGTETPAQQLGTLLREGPALGIHTILWCDSLNNMQRTLDRSAMREVGMRIVFQMGVGDSSNLIDTPAASKLGMHRALFFSEEDGRLEKFRPYGIPPEEWLDDVRDRLRAIVPAATAS